MPARDALLSFESIDEPPGIEIVDRVERRRYRIHTAESVTPIEAAAEDLLFPVDRAVRMTTEMLVLPTVVGVCVRDSSGEMIANVGHLESESLGAGTYILELSAQIKTYVLVDGPVEITSDLVELRIEFPEKRAITVGAVSWHDRPAATVTTTEDPVEMMAAVSSLGSALKETTPERSFPSNRGHPPAITLGDTLDVPPAIAPPDTGIRIEIPPERGAIYVVSPLAYYLGADVVPGSSPRLVTDDGFEYPLDSPDGFERGVERTLKQLFLLDCIARTEGVYEIELHERNELEDALGIGWETLYEQALAEQVATYLKIPYALLSDHVPKWRLTVHVEPVTTTVEQLPFVVDDLAIVRTTAPSATQQPAATGMARPLTRNSALTRSAADTGRPTDSSYVEPVSSASLEQAWIGDSIPIGASKLVPDAFQNRLDRDLTDGAISITIVLNDARMSQERSLVDRAYGNRENLPFDVTIRQDLTVAELRAELQRDRSFLHYIGHTERDGFECVDGKLDAATLEETDVDSFLLNACRSYRQGLHLIEAGAIGGIVTLNDIVNDGAVRIGETVACLLNAGFPLRASLTIARDESILGGQYIVVGDGGMTVTQAPSRTPILPSVSKDGDEFAVDIRTYATDDAGLGSVFMPHLSSSTEYFLSSGDIATFRVSGDELAAFFELENFPVKHAGSLYWSGSLSVSELE